MFDQLLTKYPLIIPLFILICLTAAVLIFGLVLHWAQTSLVKGAASSGLAEDKLNFSTAFNETTRTLFQVVGGIALGLTFAYSTFLDRNNDVRSRDQNANQLYIEASKLLTSDKPSGRAAGAYALELVATDRADYKTAVVDLLASSIRANQTKPDGKNLPPAITSDIQAALNVLGRRDTSSSNGDVAPVLDDAYLVAAKFPKNGFANATFFHATLLRADFRDVDLSGARFDGAELSESVAFGPTWNDATPTTESWAVWQNDVYDADFRGSILKGARFDGAGLSGAVFSGADLASATFSGANLSRADFRGAKNIEIATFTNACFGRTSNSDKQNQADMPLFDADVPAAQHLWSKIIVCKIPQPATRVQSK